LRGLPVVEGGIDGLGVRVLGPGMGRVWMRGLQIKDDGEGGRSGLMLGVGGVSVWRMWRGETVKYYYGRYLLSSIIVGKRPAH